MKTVLFLSLRMCPGWGVSVVVEHLSRRLRRLGVRCIIGCTEVEGAWIGGEVREVPPESAAVRRLVRDEGVDIVVAHTSPYFELLPELQQIVPCVAYEHGDPTPEFFGSEEESRRLVAEEKRRIVYPNISGVVAVSEFVRSEIDWPAAEVILNGCDHMPSLGPKGFGECPPFAAGPLRIGTLARLGSGEAQYKGNHLFEALAGECRESAIPTRFAVMGRGTSEDALAFERQGIEVHLNASEQEKIEYLRALDVFISCSQWEGFNLPLGEAAMLGTVALAFDVGAHPEVTPLLVSNLGEVVSLLRRYSSDRSLLLRHSALCHDFVRSRCQWESCAVAFYRHGLDLVRRYESAPISCRQL